MSTDKTTIMEWIYSTPCNACGQRMRVDRDPSAGKKPYSSIAASVRLTCKNCGHADEYPASAVDSTLG